MLLDAQVVGSFVEDQLQFGAPAVDPELGDYPQDSGRRVLIVDREASPSGGEVRIHAVDCGPRTEIHIIDHGKGLDVTGRTRAFDRFWRAPDATPGTGSGLGLAIARQLVLFAVDPQGTDELPPDVAYQLIRTSRWPVLATLGLRGIASSAGVGNPQVERSVTAILPWIPRSCCGPHAGR